MVLLTLGLATASFNAKAVMFAATADPSFNTTAPTGDLAKSGWELQGQWGGFLGTPIAPQYFVAARHVGGSVGQTFVFQGAVYTTVSFVDSTNSDLRIWKVNGTFPTYAELYGKNDELGKPLVVFGRGTQAGEEVVVERHTTSYTLETYSLKSYPLSKKELNALMAADPLIKVKGQTLTMPVYTESTNYVVAGWRWGKSDGVMRWGQNKVAGTGDFLVAQFDPEVGVNAGHLSSGDSSGAVFVQDGTTWKLAGINYGVEGPFSLNPNENEFQAALVDKSGLFQGSYQIPDDGQRKPASFYATRISVNAAWIQSVISSPAN